MTLDQRLNTAKARRELINKHLYRDHGGLMAIPGETLEERYERHRRLHDEPCGHGHLNFNDISDEYGHYYGAKPLRVRLDRPPKNWTITWHLAKDHNERIPGDDLVKLMFHEQLHKQDPEGWAGDPQHRHADLGDPEDMEYQK